MTLNDVYNEIVNAPSYAPYAEPDAGDALFALIQRIYETDWLKVSGTIDKKEIHRTLKKVVENCGLHPSFYRTSAQNMWGWGARNRGRGFVRALSVWEAILEQAWKHKAPPTPGTDSKDELWYREIYKLRNVTVSALLDKIYAERGTPFYRSAERFERTEVRVVNDMGLSGYLSAIAGFLILYHFRNEPPLCRITALEHLRPLIELTLQGQGLLHGIKNEVFYHRMEVRLPVWEEENYPPRIVEDKASSYLQVSVIKNRMYVPEKVWRFPWRLKVDDVLSEVNTEVRRVMVDTIGNEGFLQQVKAQLIHQWDGLKLYAVRLEGNINFNLVQCVCPSTLRVYYLRVPPEIADANAAIAWTFGERKQNYFPLQET